MDAKLIVITGCSRGLGRALARQFAALGHRVAGCSRSARPPDDSAGAPGAETYFRRVDVTDDAAVAEFADEVLSRFGPPDLLLNNAALINGNAPLWMVPPAEFANVIGTNITGVFHVIRHFVPAMIERKSGVIVNFSSGWGRSTSPEVAPYCASKWAVEGLSQALAQELPAGMAAVAVNPGIIDTEMLRSCFGAGAGAYPTAERWAERAAPFFLSLSARHNGLPLTVE